MFLRKSSVSRFVSSVLLVVISLTFTLPPQFAQAQLVTPSVAPVTSYVPTIIKGVNLDPTNPLKFDFIIDKGNDQLQGEAFKQESQKLIRYFLASLTIPQKDMWVNLSPNEPDRIVPQTFGNTEMGRDLLAQDFMLKQLTASLMSPDGEVGRAFWDKVYANAKVKLGTNEIPNDVFNKVWIVPSKAKIYEHEKGAFVTDTEFKVMTDKDYFAQEKGNNSLSNLRGEGKGEGINESTQTLIKTVIIPAIEQEVNTGKTFANLRQIYNSLILAMWYKEKVKKSVLGQAYTNKEKTAGLEIASSEKQKIYNQYLEAFRKGATNAIKEEYDPAEQKIVARKYFSGGILTSQSKNEPSTVREYEKAIGETKDPTDVAMLIAPADVKSSNEAMMGDIKPFILTNSGVRLYVTLPLTTTTLTDFLDRTLNQVDQLLEVFENRLSISKDETSGLVSQYKAQSEPTVIFALAEYLGMDTWESSMEQPDTPTTYGLKLGTVTKDEFMQSKLPLALEWLKKQRELLLSQIGYIVLPKAGQHWDDTAKLEFVRKFLAANKGVKEISYTDGKIVYTGKNQHEQQFTAAVEFTYTGIKITVSYEGRIADETTKYQEIYTLEPDNKTLEKKQEPQGENLPKPRELDGNISGIEFRAGQFVIFGDGIDLFSSFGVRTSTKSTYPFLSFSNLERPYGQKDRPDQAMIIESTKNLEETVKEQGSAIAASIVDRWAKDFNFYFPAASGIRENGKREYLSALYYSRKTDQIILEYKKPGSEPVYYNFQGKVFNASNDVNDLILLDDNSQGFIYKKPGEIDDVKVQELNTALQFQYLPEKFKRFSGSEQKGTLKPMQGFVVTEKSKQLKPYYDPRLPFDGVEVHAKPSAISVYFEALAEGGALLEKLIGKFPPVKATKASKNLILAGLFVDPEGKIGAIYSDKIPQMDLLTMNSPLNSDLLILNENGETRESGDARHFLIKLVGEESMFSKRVLVFSRTLPHAIMDSKLPTNALEAEISAFDYTARGLLAEKVASQLSRRWGALMPGMEIVSIKHGTHYLSEVLVEPDSNNILFRYSRLEGQDPKAVQDLYYNPEQPRRTLENRGYN
ncbi:MAG: hypothetical protein HQL25_06770, partial [Candidatus Omnitrophica bacterium]|nr:hypothetical protein [Candidatus Omnitrophota bacterium]